MVVHLVNSLLEHRINLKPHVLEIWLQSAYNLDDYILAMYCLYYRDSMVIRSARYPRRFSALLKTRPYFEKIFVSTKPSVSTLSLAEAEYCLKVLPEFAFWEIVKAELSRLT
jgi:hypothetical protein